MDVWFSQLTDSGWTVAQLAPRLNNASDNAVAAILPDGSAALLIGHYHQQIYTEFAWTKRTGKGPADWSQPVALRLNLAGTPEAKVCGSYRYTATAADSGRVIIVSVGCGDVLGRTNMYAAFRSPQYPDVYAPIVALTDLNTPYREQQPSFAPDGRTLFFASDRPNGLGGLDVYASYRLDDSFLHWSEPVNLGPDLNSDLNEEGYVLDPKLHFAYFLQNGQVWRKALTDSTRALITALANPIKSDSVTQALAPPSAPPDTAKLPPVVHYTGKDSIVATEVIPIPIVSTSAGTRIFFALNSAALSPAACQTLDSLLLAHKAAPPTLSLTGHTCDLGKPALNQKLAHARAQAVFDYLVGRGWPAAQLKLEAIVVAQPNAAATEDSRATLRCVMVE